MTKSFADCVRLGRRCFSLGNDNRGNGTLLDFLSARHLRNVRCWRPSQIQRLLGKPDAIFAQARFRLPQPKRLSPDLSFEEIEHLYVDYTVLERTYLRARVKRQSGADHIGSTSVATCGARERGSRCTDRSSMCLMPSMHFIAAATIPSSPMPTACPVPKSVPGLRSCRPGTRASIRSSG
jgi:hypothetical protein